MSRFTRGFGGRGRARDPRLPPSQYDTGRSWPVLTAEATPRIDLATWTFAVDGLVEQPTTWSWDEIHTLAQTRYDGAIHCVTTWSKFDMQWTGVSVDTLLAAARPLPAASHVVAYSHTGYTTNLPLTDITNGQAWVAFEVDGAPLPRDHGGPARLLVPHLYFWKSAKWVAGLRVLDHDEPGFWEVRGYHDRGDPWLEQRYQATEPLIVPAVVPPIGPWQDAAVTAIRAETAHVKTFTLELPHATLHLAGQHFVIRLTAPDGYTAQRSYSVASPPGDGTSIELTVERLPDGEVSTFLHDELVVGDTVEVRGPVGGWFVWDGGTPALLIGGGSGIVPLMAMLRHARAIDAPAHLLYSVRTPDDVIYASELDSDDVNVLYTRIAPLTTGRTPSRISAADIEPHVRQDLTIFICGSANFAEGATEQTLAAGGETNAIRVERFGPTG